ncbi:MAG: ABC transporter ATP-binding protein [Parcubacteria group bacterium]
MGRFKRLIPYIWPHIKRYPWSFYLTFIGYGIGWGLTGLLVPFIYKDIVDVISGATDPSLVADPLLGLIFKLLVIIVIYNILFRISDWSIIRFQSKIQRDLISYLFEELGKHSYKFFVNEFAGSLVTKIKRFIRALDRMHDRITFDFWNAIIQLAGMFVILFYVNTIIGIIFLSWSIIFIVLTILSVKYRIKYDLAEAKEDSKITGLLADTITNILNIKMFAKSDYENTRFRESAEIQHKARYAAWNFNMKIYAVQAVFIGALEISGMFVAIKLWLAGSISLGTIVLIQSYFGIIFNRTWNLGRAMSEFSKALSDADEMIDILEEPIGIKDPLKPKKVKIKEGNISLDDMTFCYGEKGEDVFSKFNLDIPSGQHIGIIGHSGSGKTTITKLLLRFADIQKGSIKIDGQDIRHITQDDLRSEIAYVPQDPILFHRSLEENIRYGNLKATEEEVIEVAKKAHAHEFISALPKGYNTLVGERGIKLSGGERQRVAIARAMLKNTPILILDEATSSLDAVSEKLIQEAFKELMKNRTTIVIAHRLSTIQKLDRIIVLEDGIIEEEGTHNELIKKEGIYHNYWTHQAGGFIE